MSDHEVYYVPRGVELAHPEVRDALATIGIEQRSHVANGLLRHLFIDLLRPRRVSVVEGPSIRLTEVLGDTALWLLVCYTARLACAAPALSSHTSGTGETGEQARLGEVVELATG